MAGKPMINQVVFLNVPGKGRSEVGDIPYFCMGKCAEYRRGAMHGTFEPLPGNFIKIRCFLEKLCAHAPVAQPLGYHFCDLFCPAIGPTENDNYCHNFTPYSFWKRPRLHDDRKVVYISKKEKTDKANYGHRTARFETCGPFWLETAFDLCYPSRTCFVRVVQGAPGLRRVCGSRGFDEKPAGQWRLLPVTDQEHDPDRDRGLAESPHSHQQPHRGSVSDLVPGKSHGPPSGDRPQAQAEH